MNTDLRCGNIKILEILQQINSMKDQEYALQTLVDGIFGRGIFEILYLSAKALGRARLEHILLYFISGLSGSHLDRSPLKAMEGHRIQDMGNSDDLEVQVLMSDPPQAINPRNPSLQILLLINPIPSSLLSVEKFTNKHW
jgi:hypothetical protein